MKPIFDEEAARELGYQKHQPSMNDGLIGVCIAIIILITSACVLAAAVHLNL